MECHQAINLWPIILVCGAVGMVIGCLIGSRWYKAKIERVIRGDRRRVEL